MNEFTLIKSNDINIKLSKGGLIQMKFNDKVTVIKLNEQKAMNLWGGYDDLTVLLGKTGFVTNILNPDTNYEQYGIEFDDYLAQVTRERTGIIFYAEQLEIVSE
jgi:hypothetical protein